jgi:hypothetical protein
MFKPLRDAVLPSLPKPFSFMSCSHSHSLDTGAQSRVCSCWTQPVMWCCDRQTYSSSLCKIRRFAPAFLILNNVETSKSSSGAFLVKIDDWRRKQPRAGSTRLLKKAKKVSEKVNLWLGKQAWLGLALSTDINAYVIAFFPDSQFISSVPSHGSEFGKGHH